VLTLSTADAIPLDRHFFHSDAHSSALRTSGQVRLASIERFVAYTAEAVHRLTIELPETSGIIDFREDDVMMTSVLLSSFGREKPILDKFAC
jgi:hypothetical protein